MKIRSMGADLFYGEEHRVDRWTDKKNLTVAFRSFEKRA